MIFKQLFDKESHTYTYFIASDYGREAVIIDPVEKNMSLYNELIKQLGVKLIASIDTHVHADHVTASGPLFEITGCKIAMGEQTKAEHVTLKLTEGEVIQLDDLKIHPIYTPGHTDDSYSLLLDDKLLTGDTLLIRGTGRTDFQNGDAYAQYDSIFNKLLKLPPETIIYPGHDYNGQTSSTIFEEINFNPRLQVSSADEYAELMNNLNLAKPKYIDFAVPKNLKCNLSLRSSQLSSHT